LALMIPLNIGYAQVAGLPSAIGLYAAMLPLVLFAMLASSRQFLRFPFRRSQLLPQQVRRVLLHHDLAFKIQPRREAQVLMRRPGVAVRQAEAYSL
jgi:hypothetical protein